MHHGESMHTCISCERTEKQTPLINLIFNQQSIHICPQCLPILIHHPERLASKFPGMESKNPSPDEHGNHHE